MKMEDTDELSEETEPLTFGDWFRDVLKTWMPAILLVLLIRSAIAEPFRIPSGSMVPTLEIGDHILVTKSSYGLRLPLTRIPLGKLKAPERGDVIVFVFPNSDLENGERTLKYWFDLPFPPFATLDYVKRVVGLPGDRVKIIDNVVHINGKEQVKTKKGAYSFVDDRCRSHKTNEFQENLEGRPHALLNSYTYGMQTPDYQERIVPEDHVFVMGDNRDHSADSRSWGFVPFRNIKGKSRFVWLSYDQCTPGIPLLGSIRGDRFGTKIQ